jgi:uncharacterized membrane protein YdjX (TVP38/TMEM64 family)
MDGEMTVDDRNQRVGWWKPVLGVVAVAAGVGLAWRLGAFDLLTVENIDRLGEWFSSLGVWAPVVFILLWIAACVFFIAGRPI